MKKNLFFSSLLLCVFVFNTLAQPPQPSAPLTCNTSNCTAAVSETCTGASTIVTNFTNGFLRSGSPASVPGTPGGGAKAAAVYSFYNVATITGVQINATITIDAELNCDMTGAEFNMDDDGATDQSGASIASFFAPRITAANNLTTSDARGYVQFTIRFFTENGTAGEQWPADYTNVPPSGGLSGLNYIHYDIDGSTVGSGGWFRETGVVQDVTGSVINGDASTELKSYTYTDGGNWKGFAGSVCERTGVSRCAQVAAAASYATPQTSITFRMGYDYNYTNSNFNSRPTRQYGSRFGCFSFPQLVPLPVKLISFTGVYKNNNTLLDWVAENQINFAGYDVERSINGILFESIAHKNKTTNGLGQEEYKYTDDLSIINTDIAYYRLKMMDIDGRFSYSNIITIKKSERDMKGVTISPNPVTGTDYATVKIPSTANSNAIIRIIDMSGRVMQQQQTRLIVGTNNITISSLNKLQAGVYVLQVTEGVKTEVIKFTISR
jgi:Secretion system C-terminal sorting domain